MSSHTPGPWSNQHMEEGHLAILAGRGPDTKLVALVDAIDDEREEIANSCLIAAAPDLLQSLKEVREILWARPDIAAKLRPLMGFAEHAIFERAQAVIVKAEGPDESR